jgi:hypothetical protein
MEPEGSSPCSQEPTAGPYPDTKESAHIMEVGGQLHVLAVLPPSKEPPLPHNYLMGGPQSWCVCCGEQQLLPLLGIKHWFLCH